MRLLQEIRRRKVVRVVVTYAAAAFVVLQVADIVLPALGAPGWVLAALVVLTALGFPVAVALAWAFDLTPDGVQRTAPLPAGAGHAGAQRGDRYGLALVAGVTLLSVAGGAGYLHRQVNQAPDLDPDRVLVLPFRVSADPSVAYLREGMVDLLATTLTRETGLYAVEPRTALTALRRVTGDDAVDLPLEEALPVARTIGAGQVILGSVVGAGSQVRLDASLVRVTGGRTIEARVQGSPDEITRLIDELSAQLLSQVAGETAQRLESLTSTSLPALRAYLEGQAAYRRSQFGRATHAFDRAVEIDSTFALAALYLNMMIGWDDASTPNQPRSGRLAWDNRSRLGAMDRALLEAHLGTDYPQPRSVARWIGDWERAMAALPERADAWFLYGDALIHHGATADRHDHVEAATRAFSRSLAIDSSFTPALVHLLDGALFAGDRDEARRLLDVLARTDTSAQAASYQYYARVVEFGDGTQAAALLAGMDTLPLNLLRNIGLTYLMRAGNMADSHRATVAYLRNAITPQEQLRALSDAYAIALNMGRPLEAVGYAAQALRLADGDADAWHARLLRDALFWGGDSAAAADAARTLARRQPGSAGSGALCALGQWHAWNGEAAGATAAAAKLEERASHGTDDGTALDRLCALTVRAITAHERDATGAAALLERADSLAATGPTGGVASLRALNFSIARLHELRGEQDLALRAVRRHVILPSATFMLSSRMLAEGRLAAAMGDLDAAREAYADYLRLRVDPEPAALAERHAVEAALARLTTERGR
jgi:TolB-like protein